MNIFLISNQKAFVSLIVPCLSFHPWGCEQTWVCTLPLSKPCKPSHRATIQTHKQRETEGQREQIDRQTDTERDRMLIALTTFLLLWCTSCVLMVLLLVLPKAKEQLDLPRPFPLTVPMSGRHTGICMLLHVMALLQVLECSLIFNLNIFPLKSSVLVASSALPY
jgi:hypothetical protein